MSGYSGFAYVYDRLNENADYIGAADTILEYAKRFGKGVCSALDIACGNGRLCEELFKRGFKMTGSDISEDMLGLAFDRKIEKELDVQFVLQDMREINIGGEVGLCVCTLDSLNHLDNLDDVRKTFEGVYNALEKEGLFVFDVNTLYKHRVVLSDNAFIFNEEGLYCGWQNEFCEADGSVAIYLDFFEENEDGSYTRGFEDFREIYIPDDFIKNTAYSLGFEIKGEFDGYSFEKPTQTSERKVFVLKKV